MRPPAGYDAFDPFNIELHGITPAMVRGEPRFADQLPEIIAFAEGLPLVAHNAAFDMGVIRDACLVSDLPWPAASYACTLVFSRVTWSLLSYSLPWVAAAAGVPRGHHHDPEADAQAAAAILLAIGHHHGATTLEEIATATHARIGSIGPGSSSGRAEAAAERGALGEGPQGARPARARTGDRAHARGRLHPASRALTAASWPPSGSSTMATWCSSTTERNPLTSERG